MSRRRRRRGQRQSPNAAAGKGRPSQHQSSRERTRKRTVDGPEFWGDPTKLPPARKDVRITDDPHAVPRSLGEPPLPHQREIAEHYFAAVYQRAVATAGALAAAGGLIQLDEVVDEA